MNVLTGTTSAGMGSTVIMLVLMIAIFYFMLIRPENKRKKEAEQMRGAVKKGDKIVTIGGIVGVVVDVKESRIVVETSADQVRIELEKWAISSNETAAENAKAEAKKAQEAKAKAKAAKKADKAKKDKKPEKQKKPSIFARIGKWLKDMKSELKKVQWPTRKQTVNNTVIVIICCIIVGICIWLFDALAGAVITALLDLFGKG